MVLKKKKNKQSQRDGSFEHTKQMLKLMNEQQHLFLLCFLLLFSGPIWLWILTGSISLRHFQ